MKKTIVVSLTLPIFLVCAILVIFASSTSASPPPVSSQSHLAVSPLVTQSITMTTISTIEVSGRGFAVVDNRAIIWNKEWEEEPFIVAFVQPNENPWRHIITTTVVFSDVPLSYDMIYVGKGRLYAPYSGDLLLVESDTITTLYRSSEPTDWYRCESDEKYAYCESSDTDTWSVVSFDTNVPTVIYTTSLTSWGAVRWTARDLLLASVSTRKEGWEIIEVVCITNFATASRVCHDRVPGGNPALFPHLSTLYLQSGSTLYVYSVPTLTLEATATLPSDFSISAYNRDWLLVHYGIGYTSPDTLYIYQPRQFQPPVLYKEIVVPHASVEAINNSLAVVGGYGTSIIDFARPEQVYHYEIFSESPTVVRLRDRLILAYPHLLSVYSTTAWTENGRYSLLLTETFTPATDYDHRLLMMGGQHYYLFDFSSYPPEVISGTISPDVASCLWKTIRGNYVYGTCTPRKSGYMSDRYKDTIYGYPATLRLSSMQIAYRLDTPMFGPIVSSDRIYAFVTQTIGTNRMSLTLSVLSDDPENLSVVQTFPSSIVMPSFMYWNTVDRYDRKMFVTVFDPYLYRYHITRWDLDTQQVITEILPLNYYWAGVDDLYVYASYVTGMGEVLRGFSHDFTHYYIISPTISPVGYLRTAPPYVVNTRDTYSQVFMRPEISLPYRVYIPFVTR